MLLLATAKRTCSLEVVLKYVEYLSKDIDERDGVDSV